jgi:hypothetical protein
MEAGMIDRHALAGFILFLMLVIAPQHALAEAQGYKECTGKTCSQQERNCANVNCGKPGHCDAFCHGVFEQCMKTGNFFGRHCVMRGLIKQ